MTIEKQQPQLPSRTISFQIKDNQYSIDFPNTGQLIDIETLKISLARNQYEGIANARTISADYIRFLIDAIATLTVLCPTLKKDLKIESFTALDAMDSRILLQVYMKKILPWIASWEKVLNQDLDEEVGA